MTTTYTPHYVTKDTTDTGATVSFLSQEQGLTEVTAKHAVAGYKVFVDELHAKGYVAAHHLSSKPNSSGLYAYTHQFKLKDSA